MGSAGPFEPPALLEAQRVAGEEDDPTGERWESPLELGVQALPVENRHLGIAEDQVIGPPLQHLEGHGAVVRDLDLMPVGPKGGGQRGGEVALVVDDQDRLPGGRRR